jgi:hypothetical protein
MRLTNFLVARDPPTMLCPGAGGWRAISRPQTKPLCYIVLRKNDDVPTVGPTCDGDRERAEVANHIYAQRTPLQMSDEASPILDFIRTGGGVKLDRLRSTADVLKLVARTRRKRSKPRGLEPAIDTGGPMGRMVLTVLGMVAEMELRFIRDRQRAGIDAAKAKGFIRVARSLSTARASCHFARKEWAPLRSLRPWGARARDEGFSPAGAGPLRRAASSAAIARLSARP